MRETVDRGMISEEAAERIKVIGVNKLSDITIDEVCKLLTGQ